MLRSAQSKIENAQIELDMLRELLKPAPPPSINVFPAAPPAPYDATPEGLREALESVRTEAASTAAPPEKPHRLDEILRKQSNCVAYSRGGKPCASCRPAYDDMIAKYDAAPAHVQELMYLITKGAAKMD